MSREYSWEHGYEALGASTSKQLALKFAPCSCSREDLRPYCGGCNPVCSPQPGELTPMSAELSRAIREINGLRFNVAGQPGPTAALPRMVPLVWGHPGSVPGTVHGPLAVRLRDIFPGPERGRPCSPAADIRKRLHLPAGCRLWLSPGAPDPTIDWLWANADRAIEVLRQNRLELAASPDFSVYGRQCPVTWAVNMKRSLITYAELATVCGFPVPTVSVPSGFFARRWADWLERNSMVDVVAVNAQMWRQAHTFSTMVGLLAALDQLVHRPLHFIVVGPTAPDRIARVQSALASCTVVSTYHFNRPRLPRAA